MFSPKFQETRSVNVLKEVWSQLILFYGIPLKIQLTIFSATFSVTKVKCPFYTHAAHLVIYTSGEGGFLRSHWRKIFAGDCPIFHIVYSKLHMRSNVKLVPLPFHMAIGTLIRLS